MSLAAGVVPAANVIEAPAATRDELTLAHAAAYRRAVVDGVAVNLAGGGHRHGVDLPRRPIRDTFSLHGAKSFPFRKETSDLDVALADGTGDDEYLALLARHLPAVVPGPSSDLEFYLAGADPTVRAAAATAAAWAQTPG